MLSKALAMDQESLIWWLYGERPRELNWSSLAGTCALIYYCICMYMFIPDLPMSVLEYSGS